MQGKPCSALPLKRGCGNEAGWKCMSDLVAQGQHWLFVLVWLGCNPHGAHSTMWTTCRGGWKRLQLSFRSAYDRCDDRRRGKQTAASSAATTSFEHVTVTSWLPVNGDPLPPGVVVPFKKLHPNFKAIWPDAEFRCHDSGSQTPCLALLKI